MSKRSLSPTPKRIKTDWEKCIICQRRKKNEKLVCPQKVLRSDFGQAYATFIDDINYFNQNVSKQSEFNLETIDDGEGPYRTMMQKNAKWHTSCRKSYTKEKANRQKASKDETFDTLQEQGDDDIETPGTSHVQTDTLRKVKRTPMKTSVTDILMRNRTTCMFCKEGSASGNLHKIMMDTAQKNIEDAAKRKSDTNILSEFATGDLFAQEKHYHRRCY